MIILKLINRIRIKIFQITNIEAFWILIPIAKIIRLINYLKIMLLFSTPIIAKRTINRVVIVFKANNKII